MMLNEEGTMLERKKAADQSRKMSEIMLEMSDRLMRDPDAIFDTAPDRATAEEQLAELRPGRIAPARLPQVLDDLRQLEDRHPQLPRRALHQRGGRGDQQQGPGDYQGMLRGMVARRALKPADPGPKPGVGGGRVDHRRATRNGGRLESRVPRVLHIEPEEPDFAKPSHFLGQPIVIGFEPDSFVGLIDGPTSAEGQGMVGRGDDAEDRGCCSPLSVTTFCTFLTV
jgi:hypothetical protein